MNEHTENHLSTFLQNVRNPLLMEEIQKLVLEQAGGEINLCFLAADKKNLNLFVKEGKKLTLQDQLSLSHTIMERLGFDSTAEGAEIIIQFSSLFSEGKEKTLYKDMISLTKPNFENGSIEKFISTHYPARLSSPQSRSSNEKDSSEENFEQNAERLASLIKSDPQLRKSIRTEQSWKLTQQKLEEILKADFSVENKDPLVLKKKFS